MGVYATNATNGTVQIPYVSGSTSNTIVVRIVVRANGFAESLATTSKPYIFDAELAARKREEEEAARRASEEEAARRGEKSTVEGDMKENATDSYRAAAKPGTDEDRDAAERADRDAKRKANCTDGDSSGPESKMPRCDADVERVAGAP